MTFESKEMEWRGMSKECDDKYFIHIKINNTEKATTFIPIIRKYNGASISEIKNHMQTGYAVSFDWYTRTNTVEEMNGVNHHKAFKSLIDKLILSGAELEFYRQSNNDTEPVSLQIIDNMLQRREEVSSQAECDFVSTLSETWEDDYELLYTLICSVEDLIPKAGLKEVLHYYTHTEPEIAYEGLLIELIRCRKYPQNFDFEEWKKLAVHYQLDIDNMLCDANFNGNFWNEFEHWGKSYCAK